MWFFAFLVGQFVFQYWVSDGEEDKEMMLIRGLITCLSCVVSLFAFTKFGMFPHAESFFYITLSTIFMNIAGAVLGNIVPRFSQRLTDRIREWYKRDLAFDKQRAQERAEMFAAKKQTARERKATSPKAIRRKCAQGVADIRIAAHRNPDFWEPMVAFVRVLGTHGKRGAKSELDRLLARKVVLEQDIAHLRQHNEHKVEIAGGYSHRSDRALNIAELEVRLANTQSLIALIVHQLNDLDDNMLAITAQIPTSGDLAQERRDALIKELRTTLDAVELEIGTSVRRSQEEAIARADEEIAQLSSGALRAVEANREIDSLLERLGMQPLEVGSPMSFEPKALTDVASLEAQRAQRVAASRQKA